MNSQRFRACYQYKLRGMMIPSGIYLGIFILVRFVLPLVLLQLFGGTVNIKFWLEGSLTGQISLLSVAFLFSTAIFLFVGGVAAFREEFEHLLVMNNTRTVQFSAGLLAQLTHVFILAIFGLIFGFFEHLADNWLNGSPGFTGLTQFSTQSGQFIASLLTGLGLFLTIFLLAYTFGEMAGVLSYLIGRAFLVPFWICFGLAFVLVPIMATENSSFARALGWYIGDKAANPALGAAWHFLLTAIILKGIAFLAIRKMPQKA